MVVPGDREPIAGELASRLRLAAEEELERRMIEGRFDWLPWSVHPDGGGKYLAS
jgi:hypothetical protein